MRKIQILGAFIAVLAFSALAVSSAGATLWLEGGKSLSAEKAGTSHGTITLEHTGGTTGTSTVVCSGLFVGTNGPNAQDKVTLVESLNGSEKDLVKCKATAGCFVAEPTVHAVHLPWTTELVLEGGATWDKQKGTGGEPGWEVECAFGIKVTCAAAEKAKFIANGANGAEFNYEGAASGEATCSDGGKGVVKGTKGVSLGFTVS
jgi:hypothetical protein